jgi:hypothetical protein
VPYETWVHSEDITHCTSYLSQCRWLDTDQVYVHWRGVAIVAPGVLVERSGGYVHRIGSHDD